MIGIGPVNDKEMVMMNTAKSKSQAAMIRSLLSRKVSARTIVSRVSKELGGKPTVGYVNWVASTR